jgi:orotate phosphoribosyltransferase
MNFRTINDLNNCIRKNLYKIPRNIDIVVGIPRSGLMVANLISLYLNIPLADFDGFLNGTILSAGRSKKFKKNNLNFSDIKNVLIIDDSILSGESITEAKNKVLNRTLDINILYAVVYATFENAQKVDIYFEICNVPRYFEWNIMHHKILENACVDIDGVLCLDPTDEEDDDGKMYIDFLENAKPLFLPTKKIGTLITCRLNKYRPNTEKWLANNDIEYSNLIMMDYSSKEERIKANSHASYKAHNYKLSKAEIFIESDYSQATEIARLSDKPVYCVANGKFIEPSIVGKTKETIKLLPFRCKERLSYYLPKNIKKIIKKILFKK